jgi:hypothetical protein
VCDAAQITVRLRAYHGLDASLRLKVARDRGGCGRLVAPLSAAAASAPINLCEMFDSDLHLAQT